MVLLRNTGRVAEVGAAVVGNPTASHVWARRPRAPLDEVAAFAFSPSTTEVGGPPDVPEVPFSAGPFPGHNHISGPKYVSRRDGRAVWSSGHLSSYVRPRGLTTVFG